MTVVIGKNGSGKSTLFDAFGFLADCLKLGVEEACDGNGRGGFQRIRSQGASEPISFEIYYRQDGNSRPITYSLSIDLDPSGRPHVKSERLRQRRKGQTNGRPFSFLHLDEGFGIAWKGEYSGCQIDDIKADRQNIEDINSRENNETEIVSLTDKRKLGITTLGALQQHPRIAAFRTFVEGWHLNYFTPDAARSLPLAGPQRHLNIHGDNIGNVVQFMERDHAKKFGKILGRIAQKIPGIKSIDTERSQDGRVLLRFNDQAFEDPFYAQQMSDGTLKIFAYLLLMEDPEPPPFICLEKPENGLYHKLLETLAAEFREHATGRKGGSQIFMTTHQPYFVNAMKPEEVWVLQKGPDGFSSVSRASSDPLVKNLVEEEFPLGGLWYSDYLDAR